MHAMTIYSHRLYIGHLIPSAYTYILYCYVMLFIPIAITQYFMAQTV